MLITTIITGVMLGGLYAMLGIGLSLIYGIMKIVNIAIGSLTILAAYLIMYFSTALLGGNLAFSFVITLLIMVALGFLIQHFLVNRVAGKSDDAPLLLTFGLSVIIENTLNSAFSSNVRGISNPLASVNLVSNEYLSVSASYALILALAVAFVVSLSLFINKTRFGRAMRATSQNSKVSELLGVDTRYVFTLVMCISMAIICVSGLLVGQTFAFTPYTGSSYLAIAMGVVIIGGMGSLVGTLLGGIALGLAQLLGGYIFGAGHQIFIGYAVMLVLLCLRPQGIIASMERK